VDILLYWLGGVSICLGVSLVVCSCFMVLWFWFWFGICFLCCLVGCCMVNWFCVVCFCALVFRYGRLSLVVVVDWCTYSVI